jgi:hypothetical protein
MHKRGLIAFLTCAGFFMMIITGTALYIAPHGQIAYWVSWTLFTFTKTDWINIHILSSILFVIAGIFHIYYNWKPLTNYVYNKISRGLKLKKEFALTIILTLFIIVSAAYQIPPLSYVIDLNAFIKDSWIKSREYEPPFGHAERLSFEKFTRTMGIDHNAALSELEKEGITVTNLSSTVEDIAFANNTSPLKIYMIIKKFETKSPGRGLGRGSGQRGEKRH